jgi:hypothetical protein
MRALINIAHYFKSKTDRDLRDAPGSGRAPLARIAALNSQIVALHRHFGGLRLARDPRQSASFDAMERNTLDIIIMTVRGANLLECIGIDPSVYRVEYFDGPPVMLAFEAQRIMRERAGAYDFYAYLEDDLTVTDPAFFEKIGWFVSSFGPEAILLPRLYEMAQSGTPEKVAIEPRLSSDMLSSLRRSGLSPTLAGRWNEREQTFSLPHNPHAGCFILTDEQLKLWMHQPSFYDREVSWSDPLVSASTYAPGRVFALYKPAEPHPWFLEIEHYGTFYSAALAPAGQTFGEPPLLAFAETAIDKGEAGGAGLAQPPGTTINTMMAEAENARRALETLRHSRSGLAKAFVAATWRKFVRR